MAKPEKLRIAYEDTDDGRFDCVGRLPDGTQFLAFVTGAFPTGEKYYSGDDWPEKKRWLSIVHLFDADGDHIGSETRLGGFDSEGRNVAGEKAYVHLEGLLADLGSGRAERCDIWVRLFSVEVDGVTHGLFYEVSEWEPEDGEEPVEWIMLEPWDIMFHPPWDSSEYST
ncbi:MAG: hypothetical protein ACRYFS_21190 [Janthinobacterium lividum]